MPSHLETTLHRLNDVIALAQTGGYQTVVFLLQMASLELRLKAASITEEEFRALIDEVQTQMPVADQNDDLPVKIAKKARN